MAVAITVDTDGVSGDYASLSAAIAVIDNSQLTEDVNVTCYATTSADDTTAIDFGSIDTAGFRLTITLGDTNYRLYLDASVGQPIDMTLNSIAYTFNITIDGLNIVGHSHDGDDQDIFNFGGMRLGEMRIINCKIEEKAHANRAAPFLIDLNGDSYTFRLIFANNLIIANTSSTHSLSRFMRLNSDPDVIFYNNTFVGKNAAVAVYWADATTDDDNSVWVNNLFENEKDESGGKNPGTADYNAFSTAMDLGGGNSRSSQTYSFVNLTDYRLAFDDGGARDFGDNLSADGIYAFDNDIDGNTRSAPWDIGCSEFVAAGGTAYSGTSVDGIIMADIGATVIDHLLSSADQVDISDSPGTLADFLASSVEQVVFSDTPASLVDFVATLSDGIKVADVPSGLIDFVASVADGLEVSDTGASTIDFVVSVPDGISVSDAASGLVDAVASAIDGTIFSDATTSVDVIYTGKACVTFSIDRAIITFVLVQPSVSFTIAQPGITFSIRSC